MYDFSEFSEGTLNDDGQLRGYPPVALKAILEKHTAQLTNGLVAENIDPKALELLNAFAQRISKNTACKILIVFGCRSCEIGPCRIPKQADVGRQAFGYKVVTDCGTQCWFCRIEFC
jgi:hypothetical protein